MSDNNEDPKPLPGRPFSAKFIPKELRPQQGAYYITHRVMGLELIGQPDDNGLYDTSQLMWWHKADHPMNDADIKRGDPCAISLEGFNLTLPWNYYDNRPRAAGYETRKFKSLDVLHGTQTSPSTVCRTCGYHIYIFIGFEGFPDPAWMHTDA